MVTCRATTDEDLERDRLLDIFRATRRHAFVRAATYSERELGFALHVAVTPNNGGERRA